MSDWTAGYVADIGYTYGYYPELNPQRARLALAYRGFKSPRAVETACELGFGQGLSINIHAAASEMHWYGTDFNPSQASFAAELAIQSGSRAKLFDESFEEFCNRPDLPDFDFIGLHGVLSWISLSNRSTLVDFFRRKLKVGGTVFVSYNSMPGWSTFAPLRELLHLHAESTSCKGLRVKRIENALDFVSNLLTADPLFKRVNPNAEEKLKVVLNHNKKYLAHEYFNRDWYPLYFSEVHSFLSSAKLDYACPANLIEHLDSIYLSDTQQKFLSTVEDSTLREVAKDFITNQQFRRDYWVRGLRRMTQEERWSFFGSLHIYPTKAYPSQPIKVQGALGQAELKEHIYRPIIDHLHKTPGVTGQAIFECTRGISKEEFMQSIVTLVGCDMVGTRDGPEFDATAAMKLNKALLSAAAHHSDQASLCSTAIGGGVAVSNIHQLFLACGNVSDEDVARRTAQALSDRGEILMVNARKIVDSDEIITELGKMYQSFKCGERPILQDLGVLTRS